MVGLNYIYATICELVGVKIPLGSAQQDYISFADYLESSDSRTGLRKPLASFTYGIKTDREAIRNGPMKFMHNKFDSTLDVYDLE